MRRVRGGREVVLGWVDYPWPRLKETMWDFQEVLFNWRKLLSESRDAGRLLL